MAVDGTRASADRRARARRARPHEGPEPWARRDRLVLGVLLAVSVIGLTIGWFGISDTVDLNDQTRWLGFGIAALMLGGFGMLSWLLTGLREVSLLRIEVLTEVDRRHPDPTVARAAAKEGSSSSTPTGEGFGTVAGMRRFHAASCQMLVGKDVTFTTSADHLAAGRLPCGVCLAEDERG